MQSGKAVIKKKKKCTGQGKNSMKNIIFQVVQSEYHILYEAKTVVRNEARRERKP